MAVSYKQRQEEQVRATTFYRRRVTPSWSLLVQCGVSVEEERRGQRPHQASGRGLGSGLMYKDVPQQLVSRRPLLGLYKDPFQELSAVVRHVGR